MISHHGIDNDQRILALKRMHRIEDDLDLLLRAEKAREDRIEIEIILRPVLHVRAHTRRVIVEIVVRKACMYGKNRRRERTRLHAHRRDQRELHGH